MTNNVSNHVMSDMKRQFSAEHLKYAQFVCSNNASRHSIAQEILDILIKRRMFDEGAIDDAGGRLPHGFGIRPHRGVFNLSLDRGQV